MLWTAIREINGEMFSTKGEPWKPGIWALATTVAAVVGGLGFYWKIPDSVAEWLYSQYYDPKTAKAAFENWQAAGHFGLRLLVFAVSFALLYLIVFGIYAVKRLDYRKAYARAFGVRFSMIRREHDVLDLTGKCFTTGTEVFAVDELQLAYIERRLESPAGVARSAPTMNAEGLPPGTKEMLYHRDVGPLRTYVFNFTPPLHQTQRQPVTLKTSETIDQSIYMKLANTPIHPVFKSQVEAISILVMEPIDVLELSVTFPSGYAVGGSSQIRVCYGRTPTIHDKEEQRLKDSGAIKPETKNNRQTLLLHVESPIVGLQYYLYWEPPV
jgi:hypothetical protein